MTKHVRKLANFGHYSRNFRWDHYWKISKNRRITATHHNNSCHPRVYSRSHPYSGICRTPQRLSKQSLNRKCFRRIRIHFYLLREKWEGNFDYWPWICISASLIKLWQFSDITKKSRCEVIVGMCDCPINFVCFWTLCD